MDREKAMNKRPMIKIERVTGTCSKEYLFTEELLTASFPTDEYRAIAEQREYTESNPLFRMNIIRDGDTPIGMLSYWQFDGYIYIEHFAIDPTQRGKGYGTKAIARIIEEHGSIVLEVERATDATTSRRIDFYLRNGLTLCPRKYIQPAYRPDSKEVPMHLMSCGVDINKEFDKIKTTIYKKVYGK